MSVLSQVLGNDFVVIFCCGLIEIDAVAPDPVQSMHKHDVVTTSHFVFQAPHSSNFDQQCLRDLGLGFV